jgi:PPOX class probable F420-dependent enzyme
VARLATVTSDVRPHVVPCCFVLAHDTVYSVVDAKPKSTLALRRLKNIKANAAASVLVDHYDEAWETLWWVRVDGRGRVVAGVTERERALEMLAVKYPQYRSAPPPGEVLAVDIDRWRAWP